MLAIIFRFSYGAKKTAVRKYSSNSVGSTVVMFALALPLLLGAVGIAIDFATFAAKRSALQTAADASALAGAKQLSLASSTDKIIENAAFALFQEEVKGEDGAATADVKVDRKKGNVKVYVTENWTPFFAHYIGADITPVNVTATGALVGESKVCVLALALGPKGFMMDHNSHIKATDCAIYANSTDVKGVFFGGRSSVDAAVVCSGGGVFGRGLRGITQLQTDCPPIADPLAAVQSPKIRGCDHTDYNISTGEDTLLPGIYCGGIAITGDAKVEITEGEYVIKGGPFLVANDASIHSVNTVFYLTGPRAVIRFLDNATIDVNGRETGAMAGLLFFEDRLSIPFRLHNISATNAKNLTGTIYIPKGILLVDPNSNVGEDSSYTAIVANRFHLQQGPNLVLNSDYGATSVPVPSGIHTSTTVILSN
jgi:Flp pilus assembly protein TadG